MWNDGCEIDEIFDSVAILSVLIIELANNPISLAELLAVFISEQFAFISGGLHQIFEIYNNIKLIKYDELIIYHDSNSQPL